MNLFNLIDCLTEERRVVELGEAGGHKYFKADEEDRTIQRFGTTDFDELESIAVLCCDWGISNHYTAVRRLGGGETLHIAYTVNKKNPVDGQLEITVKNNGETTMHLKTKSRCVMHAELFTYTHGGEKTTYDFSTGILRVDDITGEKPIIKTQGPLTTQVYSDGMQFYHELIGKATKAVKSEFSQDKPKYTSHTFAKKDTMELRANWDDYIVNPLDQICIELGGRFITGHCSDDHELIKSVYLVGTNCVETEARYNPTTRLTTTVLCVEGTENHTLLSRLQEFYN